MSDYVLPFAIYSVICIAASYLAMEYGQKYLYDEMTPYALLKALAGGLIMGASLTYTKLSFDTMFIAQILKTLVVAVVWMGVFILIYRFQPIHGAAFGLLATLVIPPMSTMAVSSLMTPRPPSGLTNQQAAERQKKLRQPTGPAMPPPVELKK